MRHTHKPFVPKILLLFACLTPMPGCGDRNEAKSPTTTVRIGWQTAWAVQGQMTEALKHTEILAKNGLHGEFIGFSSGPPAIEAALAGSLDVVSCGSQPALQLVSRDPNWVIVGRNAYSRYAILVPPGSTIKKVSDLKGKTVATPVGSSGERIALLAAKSAGLAFDQMEIVNLGIEEQGETVRAGTKKSWGDIDAICTWEPTVNLLVDQGLARVIADDKEINLMVMSRRFIREHPDGALSFVRSVLEAWAYYANHRQQMDTLFLKDASLPISEDILQAITKIEPNAFVGSANAVDISLTPEILDRLRSTCAFLSERSVIPKMTRIQDVTDTDVVERAKKLLASLNGL